MYCRNCGKEVADQAVMCVSCGVPPTRGKKFCQHCGAETNPAAEVCTKCGVRLAVGDDVLKSKLVAGLLGVLLGVFGVHRFYLGYTGIGVAQLVLGVLGIVTCGITSIVSWIWGLIEGVMILTGSIAKDAQGRPLKE
jgi:TM2 domain-containing membrane protein YozV/ribosomal protein L40E